MKVCVVGAGVSGVVAGAHLKAAGIDVTVFERSDQAGGVWLHDERLPPEPTYPSVRPSVADFGGEEEGIPNGRVVKQGPLGTEDYIKHAPPGPCYEGLSNNVPTKLMEVKLNSWPAGTEAYVNHRVLNEYIQDTSRKTGVHSLTQYNTRVVKIIKHGDDWKVHTSTLTKIHDNWQRTERDWTFDAVIIASGHYHACRIPDIPGLAAWKKRWPSRVQHSKSYRHPREFREQNVLLIGAGVSSTDIARELSTEANSIIQLSRKGAFDLPASLLPPGAERVIGEILAFETPPADEAQLNNPLSPISAKVILKDGRELTDIHRVIICTGYLMTLPFLRQYHSDDTPVQQANSTVLVTDGTQIHNLHKDIFYIPDPTLIFIGIPFYTATFSLFEFQAMAVAAVLSGKAFLPSAEVMRNEYEERVRMKGTSKLFHSLKEREVEYVNELVEWVNRDGEKVGAVKRMEGHTAAWHEVNIERLERIRRLFGDKT